MGNRVFDALLVEQFEIFKQAFVSSSRQIFFDESTQRLIHPGEFGTFRETICKDFLRHFVPRRLGFGTGFLINTFDEISTQCDIVVYDSNVTPLIQSEEKQRFFPVESVCGVGEIKSVLNKTSLKSALNKLAEVKRISERV
ncbi:MAG TPA: DUF6602 domain-containing protein, partial [Fibrobacteria bacterium]|nr:DUF6602 domain-containing protein [Fibrobacteria bacterium]